MTGTFSRRTYLLYSVFMVIAACFFSSCRKDADAVIFYDQTFEQIKENAAAEGKDFIIILSRTNCPPCVDYVKNLNSRMNKSLYGKVIFNVVDSSLPENQWYSHWLCTGAYPTTCVFSPKGELKAVVSGMTSPVMQCIESAVGGDTKCGDYFYDKRYHVKGNHLSLLNKLLICKHDLENGKDISDAIDACLRQTDSPYPVYLKCVNEKNQGRDEEAARYAKRLFEYDETYYTYVYEDLFLQAKYIVNPDYKPEDDALLSVVEEVQLDNCEVNEPRYFSVQVTNSGKFPLLIRNIQTSCSCMKLLSPTRMRLKPGESVNIEAEFTSETMGEFYREIIIFSDAAQSLKRVAIKAQVG